MAKLPRSMRSDPGAFRGVRDEPPSIDPYVFGWGRYEVAIEVRRTESGTYEIPGAAEPEDWHAVRTALDPQEMEPYGDLKGWGHWSEVARVVDSDGLTRWYFLADEWPEDDEPTD